MKYLRLTHIDIDTKQSCLVDPMRNGPAFPKVKGLQINWANKSQWPTSTPIYYGTCDDDAELNISGILDILSESEYQELYNSELLERKKVSREIIEQLVKDRLNKFAQTRGYDTIESACSYLVSDVDKYKQEAISAIKVRDLTWQKLFQLIEKAEADSQSLNYKLIEKELPELSWDNNK